MSVPIYVLGEALMDCVAQPDGSLRPYMGGSPFNLARAAALRGVQVHFLNPFSTDRFGAQMVAQLTHDTVQCTQPPSRLPTSLAVVQVTDGQPSYGFYREGIADRDYTVSQVLEALHKVPPGVLHTGSLMLIPPEHHKVLELLQGAKAMGWKISVDVNLRPQLAEDLDAYLAAVHAVAALADWIKASDEDLELLGFPVATRTQAGEIARFFQDQGATRVALTFGAQGAWLAVDGITAEADAPRITLADSVGAGDTFWGNCLAEWTLELDHAPQRVARTLQLAMAAAAINCTRTGCQPPTSAELLAATTSA